MKIVNQVAFKNAQTYARAAVDSHLYPHLPKKNWWDHAMLSLKRAYGLS